MDEFEVVKLGSKQILSNDYHHHLIILLVDHSKIWRLQHPHESLYGHFSKHEHVISCLNRRNISLRYSNQQPNEVLHLF